MTDGAGLDVPQIARDGRLAGKTAIVTGGGSSGEMAGTGAAMSILFAVKGANVVVLDQDESRARHTQREIESRGGTSSVVVADITSSAECNRSVAETVAAYGKVDILVNNAAIAPGEQENSLELWDRIINLNLRAAKLMMNAVIPLMRSQGGGSIVNIGSVAALRAGGGQAYSAAKAGLVGLGKVVAFEEGRHGIRVNNVAPGHVAIPMGLGFQGWSEDLDAGRTTRLRRARATMLGIEGTGWDVADAALFLASDESRYVTAVTLPVDGGTTEVFPIVMWPFLAEVD